MELEKLSGRELLNINIPSEIFSKNNEQKEYRKLVKLWHPDVCKHELAKEVFTHITKLYNIVASKNKELRYKTLKLFGKDCNFNIKYVKHHKFELGDMYISNNMVVYLIDKKYEHLHANAVRILTTFKFSSERMETEMMKYLPEVHKVFFLEDGRYGIVLIKKPEMILLSDFLLHLNYTLDSRHVAWIINSMYNILCYLGYSKLVHCGISSDNIFINPINHSCGLYGGWWYTQEVGLKIKQVPSKIYSMLETRFDRSKTADCDIDLSLILELAKELLAGKTVQQLVKKGVPGPIVNRVCTPCGISAIDDYGLWRHIISKSFGKPKFIELDVTFKDVYN